MALFTYIKRIKIKILSFLLNSDFCISSTSQQGHQRHNKRQNNDHLLTLIPNKTATFTSATPFSGYVGEATNQLKTKLDELNIKL